MVYDVVVFHAETFSAFATGGIAIAKVRVNIARSRTAATGFGHECRPLWLAA